ncbi:hypothetical protein IW15_17900 [Chryseobacterium soli]|uniref:Uncharacterized protein n=1 Tax=Chryseobacterium soli TaxID=445961 RepID=A0A086A2X2_9FLAO|nr:hypothetical protein [Chryseobacterium soli]KFF11036.1 hypothetical protein IW15_17900 [Chryseobacterium soli]
MFRTYDAFAYKNYQHPEIIGKWKSDEILDLKTFTKADLKPLSNDKENLENQFGQFLQINDDYTFRLYFHADCYMGCDEQIEDRYGFNADGEIIFYCNTFSYVGALCNKRKKEPKPYAIEHIKFTKEDEILILRK